MSRGARVLLKNTYYHIINRGNQKQDIFLENADFENYIGLLKHYKKKYHFKIFGYCLMPNHIHLILEPKEPSDLAKIMQCLTQTYTASFNTKYKKTGHLWQSRFKSRLIQKAEYLLECVYYIEVNPIRAGLATNPLDYTWSSYKDRVFGTKNSLLDIPDST